MREWERTCAGCGENGVPDMKKWVWAEIVMSMRRIWRKWCAGETQGVGDFACICSRIAARSPSAPPSASAAAGAAVAAAAAAAATAAEGVVSIAAAPSAAPAPSLRLWSDGGVSERQMCRNAEGKHTLVAKMWRGRPPDEGSKAWRIYTSMPTAARSSLAVAASSAATGPSAAAAPSAAPSATPSAALSAAAADRTLPTSHSERNSQRN